MKTFLLTFVALTCPLTFVTAPRAADVIASEAATQAAIERAKKDVPKFLEWTINASSSQTLTPHLAPLALVELSPKEAPKVSLFVIVSNDAKPQTWRATNDADLAAIVDRSGLKATFNPAEPTIFAQALASLRCAPEEVKIINSVEDIPPQQGDVGQPVKPEVLAQFAAKIRKISVATENGQTKLEFFYQGQLGGAVFQMTVTFRPQNAPTEIQTVFHGYTYFTTPR